MFRLFLGCSKQNLKPLKKHPINSKQQDISNCTITLLGRKNIQESIVLPFGENLHEWLAAKCKFVICIMSAWKLAPPVDLYKYTMTLIIQFDSLNFVPFFAISCRFF